MPDSGRTAIAKLIGGALFCLLAGCLARPGPAAESANDPLACVAGDPKTKFIASAADWSALNHPNISKFCVLPGDYSALDKLRLSAGGTADRPRYLVLADHSTDHPARMNEPSRAVISGLEVFGSWWVIDRMTIRGQKSFVRFAGDDNVLSRSLIEGGGGGGGQINLGTGNRTVLRGNVLRDTVRRAKRDTHCIKATEFTHGVRLVDNEIYNCAGDGLQIAASAGMLIENNDFYATPELYSDCNGELSRDGDCACAENGIDIKGTTKARDPAPEDWVTIANNRFWGFRRTDTRCGGTGSGGDAIVIHFKAAYISVEANVFFDVDVGFNTPNKASHDIDVLDNLFFLVNDIAISGLKKSTDNRIIGNTVIASGRGVATSDESHELACNVFIGTGQVDTNTGADYNVYYGSEPAADLGQHDLVFENAASAKNAPRRFIIRRFTVPALVTIHNAVTTEQSPHYQICAEELRQG